MYELFLETKACEEIDKWAAENNVEADPIKQACYKNARTYLFKHKPDQTDADWNDWWVSRCLKDDSHKVQTVDSLMIWVETPEGHEYWSDIFARDD